MITNDAGQIALKHLRHRPVTVPCNKKFFVFVSYVDIALAWVDPEDVDCVLATRYACCGGRPKFVVVHASEDDVRRWTNRGGR